MESIEQPIFNPYASDDKDDLIVDPPSHRQASSPTSNNENDTSPVHASKSLLSSSKQALADHNRGLWIIIISSIVFAVAVTIALILTIYILPRQISGHAAVVTEVKDCSVVGLKMLKKGGNAVDAAVAAAFCLTVIHPQSSGIGGGGFLLFHDHKNDKSSAYNFREAAPIGAKPGMLRDAINPTKSGLTVGVPGELKGLYAVHDALGSLDWSTLIQPAIDLATNGFNVTKNFAEALQRHLDVKDIFGGKNDFLLRLFTSSAGDVVSAGDMIKRPFLADTLKIIQQEGANAFYRGILGENFVKTVSEAGGILTMDDLNTYSVVKTDPIVSTFKGHKVLGMPAPSSGPVVALMLQMLDGFNWTSASSSQPFTYQAMIETFKFGFAHRGYLGDPANPKYQDVIQNATDMMLSKPYAALLREKIDNYTHTDDYYGPTFAPSANLGTTHISVIDSSELMVSLSLTLNNWFGSKLMTEDGIVVNDQMLDFSQSQSSNGLEPNPRNQVEAGMRPLSSMVPTIVYNPDRPCDTRIITGASNGTRIITGVVETLVNSFLFSMNLINAVGSPRLHNQLFPNRSTYYENFQASGAPSGSAEFSQSVVNALQSVQTMVPVTEGLSCVNAISKYKDDVTAVADWRKGGQPATY